MNNLRWPMVQKLQKWNEQNLVGDSIDRHAVGPSAGCSYENCDIDEHFDYDCHPWTD